MRWPVYLNFCCSGTISLGWLIDEHTINIACYIEISVRKHQLWTITSQRARIYYKGNIMAENFVQNLCHYIPAKDNKTSKTCTDAQFDLAFFFFFVLACPKTLIMGREEVFWGSGADTNLPRMKGREPMQQYDTRTKNWDYLLYTPTYLLKNLFLCCFYYFTKNFTPNFVGAWPRSWYRHSLCWT